MVKRRISLTVKVNIMLVTLVLLTAGLLFFSSERAFQHAVFAPCIHKLEHAEDGIKYLEPYLPSLKHYLGTAELETTVAQNLEDPTALRTWMAQQPSMDDDPKTTSLLEDYERFFLLVEAMRSRNAVDAIIVQIEKDGKTYMVC